MRELGPARTGRGSNLISNEHDHISAGVSLVADVFQCLL